MTFDWIDGFSKFKNPQKGNFSLIFFLGLFFPWAWGCSPHTSALLNPGLYRGDKEKNKHKLQPPPPTPHT